MSVLVNENLSLNVQGTNGLMLTATPAVTLNNLVYDDVVTDIYTVNPNTPSAAIDLKEVATGNILMLSTNFPITVTLTQPSGSASFVVDSNLLANMTFTALYLANPSLVNQASVALTVVGMRNPVGNGPGIY